LVIAIARASLGWLSAIVLMVPWVLSAGNTLPRSLNIFRPLGRGSPLITHQIPWTTIASGGILAALLLAITVMIIERQEY
jgi:hypothetical protein